MIIATVTALIVLFSGGYEIFFAENIEKGIKEYVMDNNRKKELLVMTKELKSRAKTYNKERKANFKDFKDLYTNYNTSEDELGAFFDNLTGIQHDYQSDFIENRIRITDKISDEEWVNIVDLSEESFKKNLDKQAKKKSKKKPKNQDDFEKTRKKIAEIPDQKSQEALLERLNNFVREIGEFEKSLKEVNVLESDLLVKKTNSKDELLTLYYKMNEVRKKAFEYVIDFHETVRTNVDQEQGENVLSAFYKDLKLAPL